MCQVTFQRVTDDKARILADGEYVGDLYRQRDIISPDAMLYIVHLEDEHVAARDMLRRSRITCVAVVATRTAAT